MLIVHLRDHHPRSGSADFHTDTMLADRVDISRESVTLSRHGEQQVLDLPASARDEQICTALGEPCVLSINHAETPSPVAACPGSDW
jgi:hypothetical protein